MVKGANSGAQVLGKRASKQTVRTGRTASDNQVSKALGEKRKLNNEQAALKKQAALEKKQREQAMQDAEKEEDLSLFPVNNVKRSLFNEPLLPSMMPKTNELMSDEEQDSEDDEPFGTVDDLKLVCDEDDNLDDDEDEDGTSYEPTISDFSEYPRFFLRQESHSFSNILCVSLFLSSFRKPKH